MFNLPLAPRFTLGPLILLITCLGLFLTEPLSSSWLAYDRNMLEHLQLWRLISGNLLHTNGYHLILNGSAVALLWALHGQYYNCKFYLLSMLYLCIVTTTFIFVFSPHLISYVGLSGALHGLFILGAYFDIRHGLKSGWLLLIGVMAKIGHEQWFGPSAEIVSLINAKVAIDAHLYGAIAGIILIVVLNLKSPPNNR